MLGDNALIASIILVLTIFATPNDCLTFVIASVNSTLVGLDRGEPVSSNLDIRPSNMGLIDL